MESTMKKIQFTCNYCAIDCNLDFYVEDNQIVRVILQGDLAYGGILVSCVVGVPMDALPILRVVVCYGIAVCFVLISLLIWS